VNEATSQTLDYTKIKNVEVPEGYDESPANDDEEESQRNELIYISARIFREDKNVKTGELHPQPKWIYEKYNQVV
jgi:hypothetical protein